MMLNRKLRWALLATAAATAFAALQPDESATVDQPTAASRLVAAPASPGTGTGATRSRPSPAAATSIATTRAAATRAPDAGSSQAWPTAPTADRSADWPAVAPAGLAAWQPPPPPPPPALAPAPAPIAAPLAVVVPSAPAFPYTLIGRIEEAGQVQVLLSSPLRTISARLNDLVDGQWRLESIQPGGAVFVWVAGGRRQTVNYRSS